MAGILMRANAPEADPDVDDPQILRRARIALASVCEPGEPGLGDAVETFGPAAVIARLLRSDTGLRVARKVAIGERLAALDLAAVLADTAEIGARIIVPGDREWPHQLTDLGPRRVLALWLWGSADLRLHALRSVAMVGARACTRYGEFVAREWSAALSLEGVTVVSGGAYGIDAAAHRGALSVDSATICVLAGGVNNVYPRGHDGLFAQIIERGILVSEAPPGEVVRRRRFLSRNRVIAALASATCVVEAAARSGAASTAHHAAELARPVLAVPGAVTSATSAGTNRLIAEQIATLAANPCDIAAMIGPLQVNVQPGERFDGRRGAQYREVIDALSVHAGLTATAIARRSGVEEEQVRAHLAAAQRLGEVRVDEWQLWRYVPGASPA
jgi:DNA processing protein